MRRYLFLLAFIAPWLLVGCSTYRPLTSEEVRQVELEEVKRLCYTCFGPHSTLCDEMYLNLYTRQQMEGMCSGSSPVD